MAKENDIPHAGGRKGYVGFLSYILREKLTTTYLDQHLIDAIDEILDEFDETTERVARLRFGIAMDGSKEPERPLYPFGISVYTGLKQVDIAERIVQIHEHLEENRNKYAGQLRYKMKFKVCNRPDCVMEGKALPLDYFYSSTRTTTGKRGHCRYCASHVKDSIDFSVVLKKPPKSRIPEGMKWCIYHEELHPLEDFYRCKQSVDGRGNPCKEAIRTERLLTGEVKGTGKTNNKNGAKITREEARQIIRWLKQGLRPCEILRKFEGRVTRGCISTIKNRPERWADVKAEEGYVNVLLRGNGPDTS